MTDDIKSMQLYPRAARVLADLAAAGHGDGPVPVAELNRFDQLHYHGTEALDVAIAALGLGADDRLLEVGAGWGGCARYLAHATGAHVTAVELQDDYDAIGRELTARAGLGRQVDHVRADFLDWPGPEQRFDHAASWLALFHIPQRATYLARLHDMLRPGGQLLVEDLWLRAPPPAGEAADFRAQLFPNSLIGWDAYGATLSAAGFDILRLDDMTADWADFTAARLAAFGAARADYTRVHGADGYAAIAQFFDKMAGYFARGIVGGLRVCARRRPDAGGRHGVSRST